MSRDFQRSEQWLGGYLAIVFTFKEILRLHTLFQKRSTILSKSNIADIATLPS